MQPFRWCCRPEVRACALGLGTVLAVALVSFDIIRQQRCCHWTSDHDPDREDLMVDGLQQGQSLNEFLTAIEAIENDFAMHTRRNGTGGGGGNGTDDAGGNSTNGTSGEGGGNGTSGGAGGNESAVADGAGGNESASNATGNSTDSNALPPGTTALTLRISMPYTLAEFDEEKQTAFKQAVAAAAGVDVGAVWINATEQSARRRLLEDGIVVETRIYGGSAAVITQTLGTGDELLAKLNAELTRLGLRASSGVILSNDSCVPVSGLVFCAHLNDLNGSAHYDDATGEHSDDSLLRLDAALERMFMMHHSVASNASCKRAFQSLLCPDMLGVCASAGGFMRACADACMAVEECLHPEWSHQTRKVVCATLGYTQNGPACVASVPAAPIAVRAPAAPVQPSQIVTFVAILPLSKVDFASREYLYTKSVAAVAQVAVSRVIVEKVDEVMTSKWRSLHLAGVSVNAGAGSQAGMASSGFDGSGLQLNEHRGHARNTGAAGVSVASYHAQGRTRTWARRSELSVTVQTQVMVTGEEEARVRQGMTLTKLNGELVRNGLPAATDLSAPITKPIAQAATPSLPRYLELVLLALALLLMPA